MCENLDLYGENIITVRDVENYMMQLGFSNESSKQRIASYISGYDLSNKINLLRKQGLLIEAISPHGLCLDWYFTTKYVGEKIPPQKTVDFKRLIYLQKAKLAYLRSKLKNSLANKASTTKIAVIKSRISFHVEKIAEYNLNLTN